MNPWKMQFFFNPRKKWESKIITIITPKKTRETVVSHGGFGGSVFPNQLLQPGVGRTCPKVREQVGGKLP